MRILWVGAGGVGGVFGARMARAGEDLFFIARGEHLRALRESGLEVRGTENFRARVAAGERPPPGATAEFVLVAVKSYQNAEAFETFRGAVGPDTRVVSLQNGIGNEEFFAERLGREQVIGGVAHIGAERAAPGVVRWETGGRVILGDFPEGLSSPARRLGERFDAASIPCERSPWIVRDLWEKMAANAVFNSLQTLYACALSELLDGEKRKVGEAALGELTAVARALGIEMRPAALEAPWDFCRKYPAFRTSTFQDRLRGNRLETEALNGAVVAAGARTGVPTPTHAWILRELLAVEQGGL